MYTLEISEKKNSRLYLCSIYDNRPETCSKYPWNHANQLFVECIFVDVEKERLRTMEEMLTLKTREEISDYCIQCGRCCFFGPAACSKLKIVDATSDKAVDKNEAS